MPTSLCSRRRRASRYRPSIGATGGGSTHVHTYYRWTPQNVDSRSLEHSNISPRINQTGNGAEVQPPSAATASLRAPSDAEGSTSPRSVESKIDKFTKNLSDFEAGWNSGSVTLASLNHHAPLSSGSGWQKSNDRSNQDALAAFASDSDKYGPGEGCNQYSEAEANSITVGIATCPDEPAKGGPTEDLYENHEAQSVSYDDMKGVASRRGQNPPEG
ncbi:hypothetical protein IAT40_001294 [Kwoniella sp. CBS 6097]